MEGNPHYWTKEFIEAEAFKVTDANWNNGNGFKFIKFTDYTIKDAAGNDLAAKIGDDSPNSAVEHAVDLIPKVVDPKTGSVFDKVNSGYVTIGGHCYDVDVFWTKGGGTSQEYQIIIYGFNKDGEHEQYSKTKYSVIPGNNAGTKYITYANYKHRDGFDWQEDPLDTIEVYMDNPGYIVLEEVFGKLTVTSAWEGELCGYGEEELDAMIIFEPELGEQEKVAAGTVISIGEQLPASWLSDDGKTRYTIEQVSIVADGNSEATSLTIAGNAEHTIVFTNKLTATAANVAKKLELDISRGAYCDIPIAVRNMPNPGTRRCVIAYDPQEIEAYDLCVSAADVILDAGAVPGTFIEITQFDPVEGVVEFVCADPSPSFTGIINTIRFRGAENGRAEITITWMLQ